VCSQSAAHFAIFDPDMAQAQARLFLPIMKNVTGDAGEAWFMTGSRYCGMCNLHRSHASREIQGKHDPEFFKREIWNEARGALVSSIMTAEACAAGFRVIDQHQITSAVGVTAHSDATHLDSTEYSFVLQYIAHFLPLAMGASKREDGVNKSMIDLTPGIRP
jgi:hypothetical protein